jgi:heptosyltransferase-2
MERLKNCRYFKGDRPCYFHKERGIKCNQCSYYAPVNNKILIIKLGAPGDVLRTTPILRAIKHEIPDAHITWLTDNASIPLLEANPFIDRIWDCSFETISRLQTEEFDLVLSLDNSGDCASLATLAKGKEKLGFGINPEGSVVPFNPEAETWLEMAAFDDIKKANKRTYQDIIFSICGYEFNPAVHEIVLSLTEDERLITEAFKKEHGLKEDDIVVGINIGAGRRWPNKRWTVEGFVEFSRRLILNEGIKIVLLAGPEEEDMAQEIKNRLLSEGIRIIDGGCGNSLRTFIAKMDACHIVVTADTLAMHIAVGLKKYVVALFGPTSAAEIELYGRGTKIVADKECVCCYRQKCNIKPYCVESIAVDEVLEAVIKGIDDYRSKELKEIQLIQAQWSNR